MSSLRNGSRSSDNRTKPSSISSEKKKSSLPVRFIKWTAVQIVSFVLAVLILGIGYAAVTWTNIPSGSGAAGQPVTQTLIQGIINNMNYLSGALAGVDTRLDTLESGQTTGGTVTGPLRWSSEYSGQNYATAWNTCLALSPAGAWRLPTADEIEYGRRANSTLFTGVRNYWSSLPHDDGSTYTQSFLTWLPWSSVWYYCNAVSTSGCYANDGSGNGYLMVFRCVSNS